MWLKISHVCSVESNKTFFNKQTCVRLNKRGLFNYKRDEFQIDGSRQPDEMLQKAVMKLGLHTATCGYLCKANTR